MSERYESDKASLARGFTLNGWEIRPMAGVLLNNGHEVHLEPKVMDVLVCLACHQGEVVTREMLLEEVWGKTIVTDDAVTRCISELRTVLGDTDRERTYIRTIPRRGYCLISAVTPLTAAPSAENFSHAPVSANDGAGVRSGGNEVGGQTGAAIIARTRNLHVVFVFLLLILFIVLIVNNAEDFVPADIDSIVNRATSTGTHNFSNTLSSDTDHDETAGNNDKHHSIRSIAVLPLVSLSDNQENEYIAEGISEDIRNVLTSVKDLRVAARTSSSVFKDKAMDVREIAAKLNVDALLEGTVRINENRLRITAQLTDAVSGYSIWASSFERDIQDKIQLQTEVAAEIAKQLVPTITNEAIRIRGITTDVRAQDLYFLGRYHWHKRTPESLKLAVEYFQEAIKLDPNYALAYSGLSDALVFQTTYDSRLLEDVEAQARKAVNRALELEPQLPEAQASMGILLQQIGDLQGAQDAYQRSITLNPQNSMAQMWLGNILYEERDINNSHYHYEQALKLDPLHPQIQFNYVHSLMSGGRYDEAITEARQFLRFNPNDLIFDILLEAELEMGRYEDVLNLAVGYNLSDTNKAYKNKAVIETLIHLQQFNEAEKMIMDSQEDLDPWVYGMLRSELAIARRDPAALQQVADYFDKSGMIKRKAHEQCVEEMSTYFKGEAAYLAGDYLKAKQYFGDFIKLSSVPGCSDLDIFISQEARLYQAASHLHTGDNIATAQALLEQVNVNLKELRNNGWNSTELEQIEITMYSLMNDNKSAVTIVKGMIDKGFKPYGMLSFSPLLDEFVQYLTHNNILMPSLELDYQVVQQSCKNIGLAKLGI